MSIQGPATHILDMFAGRAAHAQDALTLHLLHELAVFVSSRLPRLVSVFGSGDHPKSLDCRLPDQTAGHPSTSGDLPVPVVDWHSFQAPRNHGNAQRHHGSAGHLGVERASGGIGRRAGFRFLYRKVWGFESPLAQLLIEAHQATRGESLRYTAVQKRSDGPRCWIS